MSWKRDGDTVTIAMSAEDWEVLEHMLGVACATAASDIMPLPRVGRKPDKTRQSEGMFLSFVRVTKRLQEGNPDFTQSDPEPAEARP